MTNTSSPTTPTAPTLATPPTLRTRLERLDLPLRRFVATAMESGRSYYDDIVNHLVAQGMPNDAAPGVADLDAFYISSEYAELCLTDRPAAFPQPSLPPAPGTPPRVGRGLGALAAGLDRRLVRADQLFEAHGAAAQEADARTVTLRALSRDLAALELEALDLETAACPAGETASSGVAKNTTVADCADCDKCDDSALAVDMTGIEPGTMTDSVRKVTDSAALRRIRPDSADGMAARLAALRHQVQRAEIDATFWCARRDRLQKDPGMMNVATFLRATSLLLKLLPQVDDEVKATRTDTSTSKADSSGFDRPTTNAPAPAPVSAGAAAAPPARVASPTTAATVAASARQLEQLRQVAALAQASSGPTTPVAPAAPVASQSKSAMPTGVGTGVGGLNRAQRRALGR